MMRQPIVSSLLSQLQTVRMKQLKRHAKSLLEINDGVSSSSIVTPRMGAHLVIVKLTRQNSRDISEAITDTEEKCLKFRS
jgi:hypothetical protein